MILSSYPRVRMIKTYSGSCLSNYSGKEVPVVIKKGWIQWASGYKVDGDCQLFSKETGKDIWVPAEYFEILELEY